MVPFKQMSEEVFWLRMVLGIFILVMIVFYSSSDFDVDVIFLEGR